MRLYLGLAFAFGLLALAAGQPFGLAVGFALAGPLVLFGFVAILGITAIAELLRR